MYVDMWTSGYDDLLGTKYRSRSIGHSRRTWHEHHPMFGEMEAFALSSRALMLTFCKRLEPGRGER
jgi:hypothetical protein|uniref:Uncharacterized protein n=2 Tax=Picea TaxID=3328 RepID=A0A117NH41_PICGL|nr:hypothetical protein ABT39_MTgene3593 [Picea glauca]KUM47807.1 hypothetical protein ABT39_MTgene4801 [Picea glauca]KUM47810.1 hypothetical protein ABT39_MTgene4804 [Picea glauca]QHR91691.1 hypothetical protein Q903MT_gene5727 [Picea sitchensis]